MDFRKTVLTTAIVFLILALIFVGVILFNKRKHANYPPVLGNCPDYYQDVLVSGQPDKVKCVPQGGTGETVGEMSSNIDKAPSLNYYGTSCPSVMSYKDMSKLSNKQKCNLMNEYSHCGFTWDGLIPQPSGVDYCGTLDDEDN